MNNQWDSCIEYCKTYWSDHTGTVSNHLRQIQDFYQLGEDTLWITFFGRKLYWAFAVKRLLRKAMVLEQEKLLVTMGIGLALMLTVKSF